MIREYETSQWSYAFSTLAIGIYIQTLPNYSNKIWIARTRQHCKRMCLKISRKNFTGHTKLGLKMKTTKFEISLLLLSKVDFATYAGKDAADKFLKLSSSLKNHKIEKNWPRKTSFTRCCLFPTVFKS